MLSHPAEWFGRTVSAAHQLLRDGHVGFRVFRRSCCPTAVSAVPARNCRVQGHQDGIRCGTQSVEPVVEHQNGIGVGPGDVVRILDDQGAEEPPIGL